MGRRRLPLEPLLERLVAGKPSKQVASELGITQQGVNDILRRFVRESGCRTLIQAVVQWKIKAPY